MTGSFSSPTRQTPHSTPHASENGDSSSSQALDGPGILQDPWAYPLSWSSTDVIIVACRHDVYYQDLNTGNHHRLRSGLGCVLSAPCAIVTKY
ncbi:hypothetical protein BJY52DRAFT_292902 [Lactarius psammicola]|nr:hypothetical protein BJY52DRAFT_292902 [Lactarius psammicola]